MSEARARSAEFWAWLNTQDRRARSAGGEQAAPKSKQASFGFALTGSGARRRPTSSQREEILNHQRNRCLYCDNEFGSRVYRLGKPVVLQLNWDHFVPYAYGQTNDGANWVAACHVCNGSKSGRMFDTVSEAQIYIRERWRFRGFDITIFPADAPKGSQQQDRKPVDPTLVPEELARVAEYVSVSLEENAFPVAASGIHIRTVSADLVRAALTVLFDSGHVGRTAALGPARYVSLHPFRAPSLATPVRRSKIGPLSVACPRCAEPAQFRCTTPKRDVMARPHPERSALAKEVKEAA